MAASLTSASITWDTHDHGDPTRKCCTVHVVVRYVDLLNVPQQWEARSSQTFPDGSIKVIPNLETEILAYAKALAALFGVTSAQFDALVSRTLSADYH